MILTPDAAPWSPTVEGSRPPVLDLDRRALLLPGSEPLPLRGREIPFRLLEMLIRRSGQPVTKRELFEQAWRARYLGKSHDGRLHFHIARLRAWLSALGEGLRVLGARRDGYRLAGRCELRGREAAPGKTEPLGEGLSADERLHAVLREEGELTNRDYSARFGVSRSSAFRALAAWTRAGLLTRLGNGRAARYALAGS